MAAHSRRISRRSLPGILTPLLIAVLAVGLCVVQAQAQALPPTLVTKLKDAVVLVEVSLTTPDGETGASGSGFIITPDGRLSRCLTPPRTSPRWFPPRSVKLGLIEATEGELGSAFDGFVLWCYQFDSDAGTYAVQAKRIMQIGGTLTLLVLVLILVPVWIRSRKRGRTELAG